MSDNTNIVEENFDENIENINEENIENVSPDEYISKLESELAEQRKKTDEYFEHLKRNMAEFDNYKKRISKEKEGMYNVIASDLVADILPVLDNFEKAIEAEKLTGDNVYKVLIFLINYMR